jgi:hypothetical protein
LEVAFVLVLGGGVNFWTLLALALAVLWLQANAIACAALQALRAEARVRWEALVFLERCLLERRAAVWGGAPAVAARWRAILEKPSWPEDASGVGAFFEERRLAWEHGAGTGNEVLELRCSEAVRCYATAAALYNRRLPLLSSWPLSKWMGFLPVEEPPCRALGLD